MGFRRLREEAREEKTWPLMLAVLGAVYLVFPRSLWSVLTLFLLGFTYLVMAVSEALEYFYLQKRWINILYICLFLIFSAALGASSLLVSPNPMPILDLIRIREVVRILWWISLPFFAVAAYLKLGWVLRQIREKYKV